MTFYCRFAECMQILLIWCGSCLLRILAILLLHHHAIPYTCLYAFYSNEPWLEFELSIMSKLGKIIFIVLVNYLIIKLTFDD